MDSEQPNIDNSLQLRRPESIQLGASGDLWVADSQRSQVLRIGPDGAVHAIIGVDAATSTGSLDQWRAGTEPVPVDELRLAGPHALALSLDESQLFVAERAGTGLWQIDLHGRRAHRIASGVHADLGSTDVSSTDVGSTGKPDEWLPVGAEFSALGGLPQAPHALALDQDSQRVYLAMADLGQIWSLDMRTGRIAVLVGNRSVEIGGEYLDSDFRRATFAHPCGLALSPDRRRLYVADSGCAALRILHFEPGEVTTLIAADNPEFGCTNVAIGPGGFAVLDSERHALWGVNPRHRTLVRLWGGDSRLASPGAVVFDRANHSYVLADTGNGRLIRLMRDMSDATPIHLRIEHRPV